MKFGDKLYCWDICYKKCQFRVMKVFDDGCFVEVYCIVYLGEGSQFFIDKKFKLCLLMVGVLLLLEVFILLIIGDILCIYCFNELGEFVKYDDNGQFIDVVYIFCIFEEVFEQVKVGEFIFFDDGQIEGVICKVKDGELYVEIFYIKEGGGKFRADKGINFFDSNLSICGLIIKDCKDLFFVVEYVDVVNLFFVNSFQDVCDLIDEFS